MWLIMLLAAAVAFIILTTTRLKLHPFLALIIAAFGYGIFSRTMSMEEVVNSVNTGFGGTIGYIGIVILAGCVIGSDEHEGIAGSYNDKNEYVLELKNYGPAVKYEITATAQAEKGTNSAGKLYLYLEE